MLAPTARKIETVCGGSPGSGGAPGWSAIAACLSRRSHPSSSACRASTGRCPSSAKSSAARANAYTAATCRRMRPGTSQDATGKFS
jgi:hypothetical protein